MRTSEEDGHERSDHLPRRHRRDVRQPTGCAAARRSAGIDKNLDAAIDWLKKARPKFDAALDQCYGEQARHRCVNPAATSAPPTSAMARCGIKFELPKKVSWNQKQLTEIAERIVASGEKVEGYLDIKLSVSESATRTGRLPCNSSRRRSHRGFRQAVLHLSTDSG